MWESKCAVQYLRKNEPQTKNTTVNESIFSRACQISDTWAVLHLTQRYFRALMGFEMMFKQKQIISRVIFLPLMAHKTP